VLLVWGIGDIAGTDCRAEPSRVTVMRMYLLTTTCLKVNRVSASWINETANLLYLKKYCLTDLTYHIMQLVKSASKCKDRFGGLQKDDYGP
jgi:hypothetical protein